MAMKMLFAAAALMLATGVEACSETCTLEHDFVPFNPLGDLDDFGFGDLPKVNLTMPAGTKVESSCNCPWQTADCGDINEKLQLGQLPSCSLGPASIALIVIGNILAVAGIVACAYCCCCRKGGCCREQDSKKPKPATVVVQPAQGQPAQGQPMSQVPDQGNAV